MPNPENILEEVDRYFHTNQAHIEQKLAQYRRQLVGLNELTEEEWNQEYNI